MPFDALVMRGVTHALEARMRGSRLQFVGRERDVLYLSGFGNLGRWHVRVELTPALAHLRAIARRPDGIRPWAPVHDLLAGSLIEACTQPRWERIWEIRIRQADEIGRETPYRLVVELAGHLTNVILVRDDKTVFDAWRRVEPGRPGRAVWPGLPYVAPAPPPDPCETGRLDDLPPWARRLGPAALPELCREWETGELHPVIGPGSRGPEVWVRSWDASCTALKDWHEALHIVYGARAEALRVGQLQGELRGQLTHRRDLVDRQIADARLRLSEAADAERYRRMGDAILAFGVPLLERRPEELVDPSTGEYFRLPWAEVEGSWPDLAQWAYRRYQKSRATENALFRLLPRLERDRAQIEADIARLEQETDPKILEAWARKTRASGGKALREPFRRFRSRRGQEIWVGRTADENQELTFRAARPDDVWFHVKQYPGSHVLLRCGKQTPHPDDLEDAAALAAFYSRAGKGSQVAVDYTARKFVRKRPHAEAGAVLYTRERTLYVTPDPEKLRRLGAMSSLLADE